MIQDITERKKIEKKIADLARFPLENPNPVLRINRRGTLISANPVAKAILKRWQVKIGDFTPHYIGQMVSESLASNNKVEFEEQVGEEIFSFLIAPIVTQNYANLYGRKITKRKKAERELRSIERDLNRAQVVDKIGSWRLDTQKNVLLWSDENHRIFGVPTGTPMTYETFLSIVHPEDRDEVDRKWKAGLGGESYDIEHRIIVDGEIKWVREKAELEFDRDGTLRGGFGTTQDITDIVEIRQKLDHYTKHLEDLVEEKTKRLKDTARLVAIGQTAGMVGHDIRNPLQAITAELFLLNNELDSLAETEATQNMKESISAIRKQIRYINKIVADLLDFAKLSKPCIEEVELDHLIQDIISEVEIPDSIELLYSIDEENLKFKTDPNFIKRIIVNLASNALQAMPDGGKLTIDARFEDDKAIIAIEDTGAGMPIEVRKKNFQPLFTTKSKGQGFGLPVVKKLVTALKGEIQFETEVGKGTRFILKIP